MSKKKHKKHHAPQAKPSSEPKVEAIEATEAPAEEVKEEAVPAEAEASKQNAEAVAENAQDEPEKADQEDVKPVNFTETKPSKKKKKSDSLVEITKIKVISEETKSEFKKALGEALDEDAEDLGHPENTAAIQNATKISLRQVASTLFGFFVLLFAIFGIISTVSRVTAYVQSLNDDSVMVESFTDLVSPLVAADTSVFEDAKMISEDVLITSACWDIIFNPDTSYTAVDGQYTVSYLDIDKRIAGLFGAGLTYTHKTVGDEELVFEYDEDSGMYTIPAYPKAPAYVAKVVEYAPTSEGYKLKVEYVLPMTELINADVTPDKVMIFSLRASGSGYVISSLELGELITGLEL